MSETDHYLVFDLETQRDADSVGGWANIAEMRMSVGVIWDSKEQKFFVYLDDKIDRMIEHLLCGAKVIGYNHLHFDYPVVTGYLAEETKRRELLARFLAANNLDLLVNLKRVIGYRPKLENVAGPTLKRGKSADGIMALRWYEQFKKTGNAAFMKKIIYYCLKDVEVTRDLYLYGLHQGRVKIADRKFGNISEVAVDWSVPAEAAIPEIQQEALF